jgi:hypothetical protein
MLSPLRLLTPVLLLNLCLAPAQAQSSAKGTVLIKEDFSGGEKRAEPQKWGGGPSWNIPETWEIRDAAIACIYDGKKHPGKAHGKSIDLKFKAHNVRVSYRIQFEGVGAMMDMIINAPLRPGKGDALAQPQTLGRGEGVRQLHRLRPLPARRHHR